MRVLALDTTTRCGSVALMEELPGAGARLMGVVGTQSDEAYSTRLFRQVEFLLSEAALKTSDVDLFAAASGPGTFTGLRVGLTAVKGWAEVHGKPIVAMSALEAMASQVQITEGGINRIVALEDARRGQVFAGIYECMEGRLRRLADDAVLSPAELWLHLTAVLSESDFVFAGASIEPLTRLILESPFRRMPIVAVSPILAPAIARIALRKAKQGETCDALTLDAHYVRRTDAEVNFG